MGIEAISHCLVSRINDVISIDNDNEGNVNESNKDDINLENTSTPVINNL